jgi:porin
VRTKPFAIAELAWSRPGDAPPTVIKVGAWAHGGRFADLGPDGATPHDGDYGVYAIADQRIWRGDGARAASVFVRVALAPADRNPVDRFLDAGLVVSSPFAARPRDFVGISFIHAGVSRRARASQRLAARLSAPAIPVQDFEQSFEVTYRLQLGAHFVVQPDVQYVVHPGAHAPAPADPLPDAWIAGVRTAVEF